MRQIFIFLIILAVIISFVFISSLITGNRQNTSKLTIPIFEEKSRISSYINDSKGDTKLVALYRTNIVPEVKNYHDILAAYVNQINNNIQLTIDLAGDANQNKKYETVYLWLIYYDAISVTDASSMDHKRSQQYTVIVPNFGSNSNFGNLKGWYLAVFNNTDNSYTLHLSKIPDMPKDKVQVFFDPIFVGNPSSSLKYIVSSMVRVNSTFLDKPPDYVLDSAPNTDYSFWKLWFR